MKPYVCLVASMLLAACVAVPVPVKTAVIDGKQFTDSDLHFLRSGTTQRRDVISHLGSPTLWLSEQRVLVYGLRRVDSGVLWFIGAGLSGAGGLAEGETREAVYLVLDAKDVVTNWGRAPVKDCETWLSAATDWAGSQSIEIPRAHDQFFEETPTAEQSVIYFYRPRDFQHFLPSAPPARKLLAGAVRYADISQDGRLVGQIRWQSYVTVQVPPGQHRFVVDPDTDCVENTGIYGDAILQLDVAPETSIFVEIGIQAGLGKIQPMLTDRPRSEAISVIVNLRESW
jgi:hypothetical protein